MQIFSNKIGLIHFVGIGGIGMSGIAEVLKNLEFKVDGILTSIYNYYGIVKNVYHNDYLDYLTKIYDDKTFRNKIVKSQKSNLMRYLYN